MQSSLENSMAELIDLLSLRLSRQPIDSVAESLLAKVFTLRIEVVEWLGKQGESVTSYVSSIQNYVNHLKQAGSMHELQVAFLETIRAYSEVSAFLLRMLPESSFESVAQTNAWETVNYGAIKSLANVPVPEVQHFVKLIDASLNLEVGIIVSELVLDKQLRIDGRDLPAELISFLEKNLTRFGAYAILLNLWEPGEGYHESFNKMKILAGTLELDQGNASARPSMNFHSLSNLMSE